VRIDLAPVIMHLQDLSKNIEVGFQSDKTRLFQYFIKPCRIMFEQNDKILCCTLEKLKSFASGNDHMFSSISNLGYPRELSKRVCIVTTILVFLCNDRRLHRNLSLSKTVIKGILHYIRHHMVSIDEINPFLWQSHRLTLSFFK
jgi:pre-rRNA-processing protein IPI1